MACRSRGIGVRRAGLDGARRRSCRLGRDGEKCRTASDPAEYEAGRQVRVREARVDRDVRPARASAEAGPLARVEGQAEESADLALGTAGPSMVHPMVVDRRRVAARPSGPADRRVARAVFGHHVASSAPDRWVDPVSGFPGVRPAARHPVAGAPDPMGVDRRAEGRRTAEARPAEVSPPRACQRPAIDPRVAAGPARWRGRRHAAHRADAGDRRKRAARRRNDPLMARPEEAARAAEGKVPRARANRERRARWAQGRRRARGAGRRALH